MEVLEGIKKVLTVVLIAVQIRYTLIKSKNLKRRMRRKRRD